MLVVEAAALTLKAWDERQTADMAALATLQVESETFAEDISGKAEAAQTTMLLAQRTGASLEMIADTAPDIDKILTLSEAAKGERNSRELAAAETATRLSTSGKHVGLSVRGDIIVRSTNSVGTPIIALAPAKDWLPSAPSGHRYTLSGRARIGIGDAALSTQANKATIGPPRMQTGAGLARAASSCTRIQASDLMICDTVSQKWITSADLTRMLIYALLLAGPALALYGLFSALRQQSENIKVIEVTRDTSNKVLDLVMTGANAAYWQWAPKDLSMKVSEHASRILDVPPGMSLSLEHFVEYVHGPDQEMVRAKITRGVEIGSLHAIFRTLGSQGKKWIELTGRLMPDAPQDDPQFAGMFKDVTESKLAEIRTKAAQQRLRNAVQGFSGPFAIWDKRRRLLYWNSAFSETFNLAGSLRKGMSHDAVSMARSPSIRQEVPSDTDSNTQLISLTSGGWLKLVERATPEGGVITVGVDITDNMQAQDQLKRQKNKLKQLVQQLERSEGQAGELARKYGEAKTKAEHAAQTKSTFLANMSHELRTPLNAINGFSEILTTELYGPLGDQRYIGYAKDILTSGQHLLDMINDILDMAKIEAGKMTVSLQLIDPIDPVDAAVRMIRRRAEERDVELILEADDDVADIQGDPRALRQMVLNLVANAVKFTDAGGRVTVTVQQRGDELKVAVTDTGIGIPKEDIPRLANPFEQVNDTRDRNYEGTGLGLALTKSFAEMHGGRLTINSELGKGTRVAFYLPLDGSPAAQLRDDELFAEAEAEVTPVAAAM